MTTENKFMMRRKADFAGKLGDWHNWLDARLKPSDLAILTGDSSYSSPGKLWELKTARRQPEVVSDEMRHVWELKPVMRQLIEKARGIKLESFAANHSEDEFLAAPFDGYDEARFEFWHLKTPSVRTHLDIFHYQEIISRYQTELLAQQIILESCTGRRVSGMFASYISDEAICGHFDISDAREADVPNLVILPFAADRTRFPKIREVARLFWEYVEKDQKPRGFPKMAKNLLGAGWKL